MLTKLLQDQDQNQFDEIVQSREEPVFYSMLFSHNNNPFFADAASKFSFV